MTSPLAQVLSGETRFSPDKAYPEKLGAEAPEQPQNSARVKKGGWLSRYDLLSRSVRSAEQIGQIGPTSRALSIWRRNYRQPL